MRIVAAAALLAAFFLLAGCGGKEAAPEPAAVAKPLPSWYTSPPKNDGAYLYGIGEAKTRGDAVKSALDDLASQVGISIGSTYSANTTVRRGYREYTTQDVDTGITGEVGKLYISGYEVVDTYRQRYDSYFVLVRVEKAALKRELEKRLERLFQSVRSARAQLPESNTVQQYRLYEASTAMLDGNRSTAQAYASLNGGNGDGEYFELSEQVATDFARFKAALAVSIGATASSKPFSDVIRAAFAQRKVRIVRAAEADTHTLEIAVADSALYSESHGFFIATVVLTTTVRVQSGEIVGSNRLELSGYSPKSREKAFNNAADQLQKRIEKEGVMRVVGVDMAL